MKRAALTALLVLLAGLLGTAQAQVATTDLVPAAPTFIHPNALGANTANITPDNPAALAWGTPSRIAAGMIKGTDDNHAAATSRDYKGDFYGVRLVGSTVGLAAEQTAVKDDSSLNLGTLDKSNDVQVSLNIGNWLALGVGGGKTTSDATLTDMSRKELGASVRMGDVWYLGLAAYKDTDSPAGLGTSYDRTGTLAGIALRTEGAWHWYLAYDHIKLDNFDFLGGPQGGIKNDRFTVQLLAGPLLLGASSAKITPLGTGTQPDVKHRAVDVGWAPMTGLTVSARLQSTRLTGNGNDETLDTKSVALAWLW
jgi:hypothetical protein